MAEHYFQNDDIILATGDAAAVLAGLSCGSVDCVVTSVPRWRSPAVSDRREAGLHVGRELTAPDYVNRLRDVFGELRRVLRDTGTVWLNVGTASVDVAGMPWRVLFALQRDGWILRNAVVWRRSRAVPIAGRLSSSYETIFLLTKKPRYYFALGSISETRAIGDVWLLGEAAGTGLPVDVAARCIAAGCPEGGLVLDPFSGAAASGVAARRLGRGYVGIDVDARRHTVALRRFGLADIRHRGAA